MKIFKVDTIENVGENWLIAGFSYDDETGKHYILTTNYIHASELHKLGTPKEQIDLVCLLLNEYFALNEINPRVTNISLEDIFCSID